MNNAVDLHVHSTFSDGTYTPKELVALAAAKELRAMALTDHDTVAGVPEALAAASAYPKLEILPGVELSCEHEGKEVHMLGLLIDPADQTLQIHLKEFQDGRKNRNRKMVELLAEHGLVIDYEDLLAENPDCVITRANIARYLVEHQLVADRNTVFAKYLGDHCCCFVPRKKISPVDAIGLIHQAGGLAFLAHPILYHFSDDALDTFVQKLCDAGLDGIEAIYSTYHAVDEQNIKELARRHHLLLSGGSDFHGENKPKIQLGTGLGRMYVPYELVEKMRKSILYRRK